MANMFTKHPNDVGETYLEHFGVASRSGLRMIFTGFACLIHAVFPFLFVTTASKTIRKLYQCVIKARNLQDTESQAGKKSHEE